MFEPDAESMPAEQLAGLQQERLRVLVDRLLAADGVQAERLATAGVTSGGGVGLADLPRLPMTEKQDLWDAYPFGMLGVDRSETWSPCTAPAAPAGGPRWSATPAATCGSGPGCARGRWPPRARPGQHHAQRLRLRAVHRRARHSPGRDRAGRDRGPGVRRHDAAAGHADPRPAPGHPDLHAVVRDPARRGAGRRPGCGRGTGWPCGRACSAPSPGPAQMRARIEELLGLRALDIYGLSEVIGPGVAAECVEAADGLHVNEDHFLVEAVDPVTGEPVPDGTPGELVFTTLTREALPLLRYRTGDIAVAAPRHLRVRPHPGQDEQGHRPARRHAGDPRRERLPQRGGAGAAGRARALPRLSAGGGRAGGRRAADRAAANTQRMLRPGRLPGAGPAVDGARASRPRAELETPAPRRSSGSASRVRVLPAGTVPRTRGRQGGPGRPLAATAAAPLPGLD